MSCQDKTPFLPMWESDLGKISQHSGMTDFQAVSEHPQMRTGENWKPGKSGRARCWNIALFYWTTYSHTEMGRNASVLTRKVRWGSFEWKVEVNTGLNWHWPFQCSPLYNSISRSALISPHTHIHMTSLSSLTSFKRHGQAMGLKCIRLE